MPEPGHHSYHFLSPLVINLFLLLIKIVSYEDNKLPQSLNVKRFVITSANNIATVFFHKKSFAKNSFNFRPFLMLVFLQVHTRFLTAA